MKARFENFGEIEIEGERYPHDVVIERGVVGKRKKRASKAYRSAIIPTLARQALEMALEEAQRHN